MRPVLTAMGVALALLTISAVGSAESVTARDCLISLIDEAQVPAQEDGVLMEVLAQDGQQVEAGEVIARIDDTLSKLQKKVAEAELEVAKKRSEDQVSVDYARAAARTYWKDYDRKKEVNENVPGAVPQADIEMAALKYEEYRFQTKKAQFELGIAALEVNVKEASVAAADEHIRRRAIRAPWGGVVDRVIRHTGDWVQPGDPLLRLVRMDKLRVKCFLSAAEHAPGDVMGRPVSIVVKLARGRTTTFQGKVLGISPLVEANRTFLVWAEIDNRKANGFWLLRDGMRADMTIELK